MLTVARSDCFAKCGSPVADLSWVGENGALLSVKCVAVSDVF